MMHADQRSGSEVVLLTIGVNGSLAQMLQHSVSRVGRDVRTVHIATTPRATDAWKGAEEVVGHAVACWGTRVVQQARTVTPIGAPHWVWDEGRY
eukprot:11808373-Prorocentrum_lima.AAC.1